MDEMIIRSSVRTVLSLSLVSAAVAACGSTPAAPPAPSADAWAVVDGREIRRDDVEKAYRRTAPASPTPSDEEALIAKLGILNELIVQDILLERARDMKIEVPDSELDTAYAEARQGIPEETFQEELKKRNLTAADMREDLRRDLITQKLMEQEVSSKVSVTDAEVSTFFEANRAQFNRTEDAYRIAQIVITPMPEQQVTNRTGDDASTPQEAASKAQMLMERLKSGTSFGDLAADFSEDPDTAPRGGDLGFVPLSALKRAPQPLQDAVLKSTPGTVSDVSLGGGHTLVLFVAREEAGQKDLTMPSVREGITETLRGRKEQLLRAAYLSAVRNDAVIVNHLAARLVEGQGQAPGLAPSPPGAQ